MKTILAIDPGPVDSAWCVFRGGKIVSFEKVNNEKVLRVVSLIRDEVDFLVIEQIASFGMPVGAEVFETVFWSGRFAQAWGREFHRLKRHEIKMHLCQSMRAKDGNVRQALIDKLGPQGTKKAPGPTYGISGDCWAALAVAVTFEETKALKEPS